MGHVGESPSCGVAQHLLDMQSGGKHPALCLRLVAQRFRHHPRTDDILLHFIWNLNIKGVWQRVPRGLRLAIGALPAVSVVMMASDGAAFVASFLHNEDVPLPLLLWGSAGQVVFTLRFIYQWHYSYRRHESVLPLGFWIISLTGCAIIVSYGAFRYDPVLILGQSVGFFTYSRNIMLYNKQRKKQS